MEALAGALALGQGGDDGVAGVEPADVVVPGVGDGGGRISLGAGDLHEARTALQVHVHAGPVASRAAVAVAGHAGEYQSGVGFPEGFVTQPQAGHDSGAEVLHHHVRGRGQPTGDVPAGGVLQVDGHRALVAVGVEVRCVASVRVPVGRRPRKIGMPAALDPHHVRPQVRQQPGAERRRQHVAEVEDADPGQGRSAVVRCHSALPRSMPRDPICRGGFQTRPCPPCRRAGGRHRR